MRKKCLKSPLMKWQYRIPACNIFVASLLLASPGYADASPKWRLFLQPDKPIQSLVLLFVDPPTSENSDRQKNFTLSAMGLSPCATWIGQRAAMLVSQSGIEAVFGGTYNRKEIASVLNRSEARSFNLLFTPINVSTGRDGIFAPTFAHINYRVRLFSPRSDDSVVFESSANLGNSVKTNFIDHSIWQLSKDMADAGLISMSKSVRPEPVTTPAESCPALVK